MTQNKPTDEQKAKLNGHEPGSLRSKMSVKHRRELDAWLKRKAEDSAAYERQLRT